MTGARTMSFPLCISSSTRCSRMSSPWHTTHFIFLSFHENFSIMRGGVHRRLSRPRGPAPHRVRKRHELAFGCPSIRRQGTMAEAYLHHIHECIRRAELHRKRPSSIFRRAVRYLDSRGRLSGQRTGRPLHARSKN